MPNFFQFTIDLASLGPVKRLADYSADKILELARRLRKSGSDIVVENDLANIFGRGRVDKGLLSGFKGKVLAAARITPFHPTSLIHLSYGPAATVDTAVKSADQSSLATVIQLSMLCAFHDQSELSSVLAECMTKRCQLGRPGARLDPGFEGIEATLQTICAQTDAFPWNTYLESIESRLRTINPGYQLYPFDRSTLLHLPPSALLAAMDMLYLVQSLPEQRKIVVKNQRGMIILIIWAHFVLSLTVTIKGFGRDDVTFGRDSSAHVVVLWVPNIVPAARDDTEVLLLDSNAEILIKVEPENLQIGTIASDERHTLRGFGTQWLRKRCNSFIITLDEDALYQGLVSYATAMAYHICERIRQDPLGKPRVQARVNIDDRSPPMIARENILSASKLIFQGIEIDANLFTQLYEEGVNIGSLEDFPMPRVLTKYLDKTRAYSSALKRLELGSLSVFIVMVAGLANLEECAEAPLALNLGNIRDHRLVEWLWRQHDRGKKDDIFYDYAFFELFVYLLDGPSGEHVDTRCFAFSNRGWTLVLDVVGDNDPEDVDLLRIHLKRGVPTNSVSEERKYRMLDMDSWSWGAVPPRTIFDRSTTHFVPRCVTHVHERAEFVTTRSKAFFLRLDFKATEDAEPDMIRDPEDEQAERQDVWQEGSIMSLSAGYRELHDTLWGVLRSSPCEHSKVQTHARLGSGVATTNCLYWEGEGETEGNPEVPQRICVLLVKGDKRSRWLAIQTATSNRGRNVILRSRHTCVDCAIDQVVDRQGRWLVII